MREKNFWEQFEKTGNVMDYLNFVHCTKEEIHKEDGKEGGCSGSTTKYDRDGINRNAYW